MKKMEQMIFGGAMKIGRAFAALMVAPLFL